MVFATQTAQSTFNPLALIAGVFRAIGNGLISLAENNQRVVRAQELMDLSDEQLASRGMKREDIVKHVFNDVMYI